jgi:hypothetical protein
VQYEIQETALNDDVCGSIRSNSPGLIIKRLVFSHRQVVGSAAQRTGPFANEFATMSHSTAQPWPQKARNGGFPDARVTIQCDDHHPSFLNTQMYSVGSVPFRSEILRRVGTLPVGPHTTLRRRARLSTTFIDIPGNFREAPMTIAHKRPVFKTLPISRADAAIDSEYRAASFFPFRLHRAPISRSRSALIGHPNQRYVKRFPVA